MFLTLRVSTASRGSSFSVPRASTRNMQISRSEKIPCLQGISSRQTMRMQLPRLLELCTFRQFAGSMAFRGFPRCPPICMDLGIIFLPKVPMFFRRSFEGMTRPFRPVPNQSRIGVQVHPDASSSTWTTWLQHVCTFSRTMMGPPKSTSGPGLTSRSKSLPLL